MGVKPDLIRWGWLANNKEHNYLFVVVDRFNKMCILMPCKMIIHRISNKKYVILKGLGALWDSK
jgi:hypothetical protein